VTTILTELRLRRVLLALDVAGAPQAALSFAVTLAARFEADLEATLLAEAELTRAATLPFATEVSLLAGMERRLDASLMQRSLQGTTARLRAVMAELAGPVRVRWSLQVSGGPGWETLLAELGEGSLLVRAHPGHHMPAAGTQPHEGVCVVFDQSPAGRSALELARSLDPRAVCVPAASAGLAARLTSLRPQTLILPAGFFTEHAPMLRPLLARLGCTLLVVGQGGAEVGRENWEVGRGK
jgi:hypothetical protein